VVGHPEGLYRTDPAFDEIPVEAALEVDVVVGLAFALASALAPPVATTTLMAGAGEVTTGAAVAAGAEPP